MKSIVFAYFIVSLLIFSFEGISYAAQKHKEIVYSFPAEGWPPFLIKHPNGDTSGIMVDVLKAIAHKHEYTLTFKLYPEKRAVIKFKKREIDIFPKAKEWVKNPEQYLWTDPILMMENSFWVRKSATIVYNSPEDLIGMKLGTVLGFNYPKLEPYFADKRIDRINAISGPAMLEMLSQNRTDIAIMEKRVALWLISQTPELQGKLKFIPNPLEVVGNRFMFNNEPKWKVFVTLFNQELTRMNEDGRMEKILDKYR